MGYYVDFTAGNKDYKLKINTRNIIGLERQLGCNPVSIFGDGDRIPTITEMIHILYASLQQFNHGVSLNSTYDIFDEYLADGHSATDFIPVIVEVYKVSGLISNDESDGEPDEKN